MPKVRVIGKPYGSRPVGEVFLLTDVEARALVALKRVERFDAREMQAEAPKKATKKRTYKRRDMQPED